MANVAKLVEVYALTQPRARVSFGNDEWDKDTADRACERFSLTTTPAQDLSARLLLESNSFSMSGRGQTGLLDDLDDLIYTNFPLRHNVSCQEKLATAHFLDHDYDLAIDDTRDTVNEQVEVLYQQFF